MAYILGPHGPGVYADEPDHRAGRAFTVVPYGSPDYDVAISVGRIHAVVAVTLTALANRDDAGRLPSVERLPDAAPDVVGRAHDRIAREASEQISQVEGRGDASPAFDEHAAAIAVGVGDALTNASGGCQRRS